MDEQLEGLRALDAFAPALHTKVAGRLEALSGRSNVEGMPHELQGRALLVSGHHGFTRVGGDGRIICDSCHGSDRRPLEAVLLPSTELVRSEDWADEATSSSSSAEEV